MLRHFIALGLAFTWTGLLLAIFLRSSDDPYSRARLPPPTHRVRSEPNMLSKAAPFIPMIICTLAACYFLIDSFRRTYRGDKAMPVALTVFGLLTLGLSSFIYYAIWGRHPLHPKSQIFSTAFCAHCLASTTDTPAPGTFIYNGLIGTRMMASSDACPDCKSVIRTLWVWFLLPIAPLASYRIIHLDQDHYLGRRLPRINTRHILSAYAIALALAAILVITIIALGDN